MILIIGKSSLSEELVKILNDTTVVGRPEYDFSQQTDCDKNQLTNIRKYYDRN